MNKLKKRNHNKIKNGEDEKEKNDQNRQNIKSYREIALKSPI
jgi:hypothetical protein